MKKSEIRLIGLQIKSAKKLNLLASLLDEIEKEFGIKTVKIQLDDCWLCTDLRQDVNIEGVGNTPMGRMLLDILDIN